MSLTKSKGNMYGWVTHQWPVLAGACPKAARIEVRQKPNLARLLFPTSRYDGTSS
jgi:hypothetical protein